MACSMRRKGHPSFPSAMTGCFFSSLKTLLMPKEPIRAPLGVNVPGLPMAGFQLTLHGRIWVTPEDARGRGSWQSSFLGDPGAKFFCEKLRKSGRKKKRSKEEGKNREGIQTAELDRRDQVTATAPGPVSFETGEQRSLIR